MEQSSSTPIRPVDFRKVSPSSAVVGIKPDTAVTGIEPAHALTPTLLTSEVFSFFTAVRWPLSLFGIIVTVWGTVGSAV
ncbi:hypothetical protein D3C87_1803220 [compost metagenome]